MSQETCPRCGKPTESCTCEQRPNQLIEIKHTGFPTNLGASTTDPEKVELREKLEQRKNELQIIALKKLEGEVTEWASVITDETKRKATIDSIMDDDDPLGNFQRKKEMLSIMRQALEVGGVGVSNDDDDVETPPPAGDGRAPPARKVLGSGLQQINRIYNTLESKDATDEQKARARRKADQLVDQFIKGRQKAIREDPRHNYYVGYFVCPKCDKAIPARKGTKRATKCPHCDTILTQRKA